jgi:hypothetical protein
MAKHRTEVLYLRVTPELKEQLTKIADDAQVTINDAADYLLKRALNIPSDAERIESVMRYE